MILRQAISSRYCQFRLLRSWSSAAATGRVAPFENVQTPSVLLFSRSLGSQSYSSSKGRSRVAKKDRRSETGTDSHESQLVDDLIKLKQGLELDDVKAVVEHYGALRGRLELGPKDASDIAQVLLTAYLNTENRKRMMAPNHLIMFAKSLVLDIQRGTLPPSPLANAKLLQFFCEARSFQDGRQFMSWLFQQEDEHLSQGVFAAAIELSAYQGRSADEIEDMYRTFLQRFPAVFLEYHLSHNAVLPDRKQALPVPDVPRQLLKALATARLFRSATQEAYLTLDTSLRLLPTLLSMKDFEDFIRERPVSEAYRTFLLACSCVKEPRADLLNSLLSRLRALTKSDPEVYLFATRACITAVYAYHASGQPLSSRHQTEVLLAVLGAAHDPLFDRIDAASRASLVTSLITTIGRLETSFADLHVEISEVAQNAKLLALAGKGRRPDLVGGILQSLQMKGSFRQSTSRSCIEVAGLLEDENLLRFGWQRLLETNSDTNRAINAGELRLLAVAAIRCGATKQWEDELIEHCSDEKARSLWIQARGIVEEAREDGQIEVNPARLQHAVQLVSDDVEILCRSLSQIPSPDHINSLPPAMSQQVDLVRRCTEEEMRQFYEEVTSDKTILNARVPISDATANLEDEQAGSHGRSIGEVRYRNWRTITELMAEAEEYDDLYSSRVARSRINRLPMPEKDSLWSEKLIETLKGTNSIGLSDVFKDGGQVIEAVALEPQVDVATARRLRRL